MKTPIIIAGIAILGIGGYFAGTSLSKSNKSGNGNEIMAKNMDTNSNTNRNTNEVQERSGQFGQNPDITGKVKSIGENEIVISQFKTPSRTDNGSAQQRGPQGFESMNNEERAEMREQAQDRFQDQEREIIGEVAIAITDDTVIQKRNGGFGMRQGESDNDQQEEINLSDIQTDDGITVWLEDSESDSKTAKAIIVNAVQ